MVSNEFIVLYFLVLFLGMEREFIGGRIKLILFIGHYDHIYIDDIWVGYIFMVNI